MDVRPPMAHILLRILLLEFIEARKKGSIRMRKLGTFIICFLGLTQPAFTVINSHALGPEVEIDDQARARWQLAVVADAPIHDMPQLDILNPESVQNFIKAVDKDCLRSTWQESERVLTTYLKIAHGEFFKSIKQTDQTVVSRDGLMAHITDLGTDPAHAALVVQMTPLKEELDRSLLYLSLSECFYRKYLNALDIVALKILNKKQLAEQRALLARS